MDLEIRNESVYSLLVRMSLGSCSCVFGKAASSTREMDDFFICCCCQGNTIHTPRNQTQIAITNLFGCLLDNFFSILVS